MWTNLEKNYHNLDKIFLKYITINDHLYTQVFTCTAMNNIGEYASSPMGKNSPFKNILSVPNETQFLDRRKFSSILATFRILGVNIPGVWFAS